MKKNYRTVTVIKMIQEKDGEISTLCQVIIDRAAAAGQNITPFLQSEIRMDNKKACSEPSCLLHKGYQGWKDTAYNDYYKQVNTTQARCRQIAAAAAVAALTDDEKAEIQAKKAAAKKAADKKKSAAAAKVSKAKTDVTRLTKQVTGWKDRTKSAKVALKAVQAGGKKQLNTIDTLKKKVAKLEIENARIKREFNGHKGVYNSLWKALKAATTLKEYQAII